MVRIKVRRKDLIRNRKDKRYVENQDRLECAIGKFLKSGWLSRMKVPAVSNEAKVWESTFYDHYIHMDEAINMYFHKMDPKLKSLAAEVCDHKICNTHKNINYLETVFFRILYFVYQNRDYYDVIIGQGYTNSLIRIPEDFRPVIERGWSNYGDQIQEKCFCLFSWEFGGLVYYWGYYENFDYDRIGRYVKELSRLAQNTTKRLLEA